MKNKIIAWWHRYVTKREPHHFDFVIEGLTDKQIEKVWDILVATVESCDGTIIGWSSILR